MDLIENMIKYEDSATTVFIHGLKHEVDEGTQQACFYVQNIEENSKTVGDSTKRFLWQSQKWVVILYDESNTKRARKKQSPTKRTFKRRRKNEDEGCSYEVTEVISVDVKEDASGTSHLREYIWKPNVVNTEETFILVTYYNENEDIEPDSIIPANLSTSYVSNVTREDFEMTYDDAVNKEDFVDQPPVGALAKLTYISEKLLHLSKVEVNDNDEEKYEVQPINVKMSNEPVTLWVSQYEGRYGLSTSHFQLSEQFGQSCESQVLTVRTHGGYLSDLSLSFSEARRSKRFRHRKDYRQPHYQQLPEDVIVIDRLDEEEQKPSSDDEGFEEIELEGEQNRPKASSSSGEELAASPPSNYGSYTSSTPIRLETRHTSSSTSDDATSAEDCASNYPHNNQDVFTIETEDSITNHDEADDEPELSVLSEYHAHLLVEKDTGHLTHSVDEEVVETKKHKVGDSKNVQVGGKQNVVDVKPIMIQKTDCNVIVLDVAEQSKTRNKLKKHVQIQEGEIQEIRGAISYQSNEVDFKALDAGHDVRDSYLNSTHGSNEITLNRPNFDNLQSSYEEKDLNSDADNSSVDDDVAELTDFNNHINIKLNNTTQTENIHNENILPKDISVKRTRKKQDDVLDVQPVFVDCRMIGASVASPAAEEVPSPLRSAMKQEIVEEEQIEKTEKTCPEFHKDSLDAENDLSELCSLTKVAADKRPAATIVLPINEEVVREKPSPKVKSRSHIDASVSENDKSSQFITETKVLGADVQITEVADEKPTRVTRAINKDLVLEENLEPVESENFVLNQEPDFSILDKHKVHSSQKTLTMNDILIQEKNEPLPAKLSEFNNFKCTGINNKNTITKTEKLLEEDVHEKKNERGAVKKVKRDDDDDEDAGILVPLKATTITNNIHYTTQTKDGCDKRDKPIVHQNLPEVSEDEIQQAVTTDPRTKSDLMASMVDAEINNTRHAEKHNLLKNENSNDLLPKNDVAAKTLPDDETTNDIVDELTKDEIQVAENKNDVMEKDSPEISSSSNFNVNITSTEKQKQQINNEKLVNTENDSETFIHPEDNSNAKLNNKPDKKSVTSRAKKMILKPFKSSKKSSKNANESTKNTRESTNEQSNDTRDPSKITGEAVSSNDTSPDTKKKKVRSKFIFKRNGTPKMKSIKTAATLANDTAAESKKSKKVYQRSQTMTPTIAARITLLRQNSRETLLEEEDGKQTRRTMKRSRSFDSMLSPEPYEDSLEAELKERQRRLAGYSYLKPGAYLKKDTIVKSRQYTMEACERETSKEITFIKEQRRKKSTNKSMAVSVDMLHKVNDVGSIQIPNAFLDRHSRNQVARTTSVGRIAIPKAFSVEDIHKLGLENEILHPTVTQEMLI